MLKRNSLFAPLIIILGIIVCVLIFGLGYQVLKGNPAPATILSDEFLQSAWVFNTTDKITSTPAADNDGKVYIRTSNSIIALDTQTGKSLWRAEIPENDQLSIPPQAFEGYLAVPTIDSQIAVFSADTGQLLWASPIIEPNFGTASDIKVEAFSFIGDLLIVARHYWMLTAYSLADGQVVWEQDISHSANPFMVIDRNILYLSSSSLLKAFDSQNGNLLWQKEFAGYLGQMLTIDDTLYVIDEEYSSLIMLDLNSHEILSRKYYNAYIDGFTIQCFSSFDDMLYISAKEMLALSTDGDVIWVKKKTGMLECPATLKKQLFVRNISSSLFVLDKNSGQELGKLAVQKNTRNKYQPDRSPTVVDDLVIIPVDDYQINSYHSE